MPDLLNAYEDNIVMIRRIIARYGIRPGDVEDIAQETFLRAFAAQTETKLRNPKAFLIRVARNLAASELKRKVNTTSVSIEQYEDSDVLMNGLADSPEKRIEDQRKLLVMVKAVASLSPALRETFIMRKVDQLKFQQIATRLSVSVSTVEKRAATALLAIDRFLRTKGYDLAEFSALAPNMGKRAQVKNYEGAK